LGRDGLVAELEQADGDPRLDPLVARPVIERRAQCLPARLAAKL
jgi:hypothetical protein